MADIRRVSFEVSVLNPAEAAVITWYNSQDVASNVKMLAACKGKGIVDCIDKDVAAEQQRHEDYTRENMKRQCEEEAAKQLAEQRRVIEAQKDEEIKHLNQENEEMMRKHNKALEQVKEDYKNETTSMNNQTKRDIDARDSEIRQLEERIDQFKKHEQELKDDHATILATKADAIKDLADQLRQVQDSKCAEDYSRATQAAAPYIKEAATAEHNCKMAEATLEKAQEECDRLRGELAKIQDDLQEKKLIDNNSSIKGQEEELMWKAYLEVHSELYHYEYTAGKPKMADHFIIDSMHHKIISMDNKNNGPGPRHKVPEKEIEKLERDMIHNNADLGVLTARHGITGVDGITCRTVTHKDGRKVPMYLCPNIDVESENSRTKVLALLLTPKQTDTQDHSVATRATELAHDLMESLKLSIEHEEKQSLHLKKAYEDSLKHLADLRKTRDEKIASANELGVYSTMPHAVSKAFDGSYIAADDSAVCVKDFMKRYKLDESKMHVCFGNNTYIHRCTNTGTADLYTKYFGTKINPKSKQVINMLLGYKKRSGSGATVAEAPNKRIKIN